MFIRTNGRLINTDHIEILFIDEHTSMKAEECHDGYIIKSTLDNGIKVNLEYLLGLYDDEQLVERIFNQLIHEMSKAQHNSVIDLDRICGKAKGDYETLIYGSQEGSEDI